MYKFRDVGGNGTVLNGSALEYPMSSPHGKTPFQASFTSYLAIASNLPSTLTFIINVLISKW
jgi:hypothetical protein